MEVLIKSQVKLFFGNEYNSYMHTALNATVISTRKVYEKTVIVKKQKNKGF